MTSKIVVACLGKRLLNNNITIEYAARIETMKQVIGMLQQQDQEIFLVGFSGGCKPPNRQSEAEAGRNYFIRILDPVLKEIFLEKIFLDPYAENTIQNIQNLYDALVNQDIDPGNVHLMLVSSDYHIDRILMIDRLMPLQSLCARLHKLVGQVSFYRAPYPPSLEPVRTVYLLKDLLNIMQVNLEGTCGIIKLRGEYHDSSVTLDRLLPESISLFSAIVKKFAQILKSDQEVHHLNDMQVTTLVTAIDRLKIFDRVFHEIGAMILFPAEPERQSLRNICQELDQVNDTLNIFDPDQPLL